jgi:hypothetical protein
MIGGKVTEAAGVQQCCRIRTSESRNARASSISARACEISFKLQGMPSAQHVNVAMAGATGTRHTVVLVGHNAGGSNDVAIQDQNLAFYQKL